MICIASSEEILIYPSLVISEALTEAGTENVIDIKVVSKRFLDKLLNLVLSGQAVVIFIGDVLFYI